MKQNNNMTKEKILDAILMSPGLVINVREKDSDNCIQYVVLRLKKDFAVVSSRNMVFHEVTEDFWYLSEFLRDQHIDYEQVEFVDEFDPHRKDMNVLYSKPQKVEMTRSEIEEKLGLEPDTLVIKSEYDTPEVHKHYDNFGT